MAISLIPNKKRKRVASGALSEVKSYVLDFLPALAVLGIVITLYIIVSVWFGSLKSEYSQINSEKTTLLNATRNTQTEDLKNFVSKARALKAVIDEHITISEAFRPLEDSVHRQIVFTSIDINSSTKEMSIDGIAPDFEALGEQFVIWKDEAVMFNEIELVSFERKEEGNIIFKMSFDIKEDYLK